MKVDVQLPSGSGCSIEVSPETRLSELKAAAQQHFQRRLKLTARGRQLDLTATVSQAGLRDGDAVDAVVQRVMMAATNKAFALHTHGSNVVTWGSPEWGGDSSQVQAQLKNVQQIQGNDRAFAAILESGAAVAWGDPRCGGDSSQVQEQLVNVQQIQASTSGLG